MKFSIQKMIACMLTFSMLALFTGALAETTGSTEDTAKLNVAVTILPQATFVQKVAGNLADVIAMVPAGNSPGNYEPSPMQMQAFNIADVFFTIGVPTETANIIPQIEDLGVDVVSLADAAAAVYPERTFATGGRDPHVWMSPKRVMVMVQAIADELAKLDPDDASTFQANADNYIAELAQLDADIAAQFDTMTKKEIIVYHPAYGYLCDDYGLTMYALQAGGKDASPEDFAKVVDIARNDGIDTIFSMAEIDSPQVTAFAEEIGGNAVIISPLAPNYVENLRSIAAQFAGSMQ